MLLIWLSVWEEPRSSSSDADGGLTLCPAHSRRDALPRQTKSKKAKSKPSTFEHEWRRMLPLSILDGRRLSRSTRTTPCHGKHGFYDGAGESSVVASQTNSSTGDRVMMFVPWLCSYAGVILVELKRSIVTGITVH